MSTKLAKMPTEKGSNYKIWENKEFECWGTITSPEGSTNAFFEYPSSIKNKISGLYDVTITPWYNNYGTVIYTMSTSATGINAYFFLPDGSMISKKQEALIFIKGKLK